MLRIDDFTDMNEFENIMSNWAQSTGLATVAVGHDGRYISKCYNFTDFCIKLTRGSKEGCRRCERCDREGHGIYHCHAGLIDFSLDLIVAGEKVGQVIGGQVLPAHPDENEFRKVAREIGVDEDEYIEALHHVNVRTEETINAAAKLLGEVLNNFINAEYNTKYNSDIINRLSTGVKECENLVRSIVRDTKQLEILQKRQQILALNATIEAARAGEAGRGFRIVAENVGVLSAEYLKLSNSINKNVNNITTAVHEMVTFKAVKNDKK